MHFKLRKIAQYTAMALAAFAAAGCSDDDNGGPVTPPGPTGSFVGYADPATGQTTCGSCHKEKQATWAQTGHATAWADLQTSSHAGASCNPCHTTSGFGNPDADNNTGFFAVADTASKKFYYDVQCESCHGSGMAHIAGPETTLPLASMAADSVGGTGCAVCHNGSHHPFDAEWKLSRHGIADPHMTGNTSCQRCHEGRGRLALFDPGVPYAERTAGPAQAITCTVCHDPHGSDNPAELRLSIDDTNPSNNLCMSCHAYRLSNTVGSSRANSGHGTQGGVLVGIAGWLPPGFTTGLQGSHSSSANPGLCAGCHMDGYSATTASGTSYSTGHRFLAIPCIDPATGMPDATQACTSLAERRFGSCAKSGCHSTEDAARAAFTTVEARINNYVRVLWIDVDGDKVVDAFPADSGLLAQVKAMNSTYVYPNDSTITVGDGAQFNAAMLGHGLSDHPDGSSGTHNPFHAEALLIATINAVRSTYGLPAPPAETRLFTARLATIQTQSR